jgi:MFS family permease
MRVMRVRAAKSAETIWTRPFIQVMLVATLAGSAITLQMGTLPMYVKHLGGSDAMSGLVVGVLGVAALMFRLPVGWLLDRYGRKGLLLLGLVILGLDFGTLSFAATVGVLLVLRFVQGVGNCAQATADAAMAADFIPKAKLASGLGYFSLAQSLPQALGPMMGLFIIQQFGYRYLFLVGLGFVTLAFIASLGLPERYRPSAKHKPVPAGVLLKNLSVVIPSVIVAMVGLANSAVISFIAPYAAARHISGAGYYFLIVSLATVCVRLFGNRLLTASKRPVLIGSCLSIIVAFSLLAEATSFAALALAALLYGLGFGCLLPRMNAVVLQHVSAQARGSATAIFSGALDAAYGGGVMIFGVIATAWGYHVMFLAIAATASMALWLLLIFHRRLLE